ncbi:MAG TPA: lamin tail domain-containing protein [Bacteroidetes bacterium]|nr:lamin tail domain-containing protein [Bacteroidota bacterium]
MKHLILSLFIVLIGISSCVKDEDLKEPSIPSAGSPIFLNELVSTGSPDYVELYNASDAVVDITGYTISDGGSDYVIPSGSVDAYGYLVILADDGNTVDDEGVIHTNFKISSKGEPIKLVDTEGKLVDQIDLPPMDDGTAYGRTTDGGPVWDVIIPSPGAPNSNNNTAPVITADTILSLDDNTQYTFSAIVVDLSGVRDVKLYYKYDGEFSFVDMVPLGGNEYAYKLPAIPAGEELEYYIMAADETGLKSYFPESAPDNPLKVVVENGYPVFSNFNISTENPAADEEVTIKIDVYDATGIDDVRLYYVTGDQTIDDKVKIVMSNISGNTYEGKIPGQPNNTVVKYYMRAEDLSGQKIYYPLTEGFDHDILSTWPSYTVAPPVILEALVLNEIEGHGDPDYIELYNGTNADIDLGGYKLHDKDPSEAYEIPGGTIIPAGGFWTLDCDGGATTLFKISSSGESITLLDASGNIVDQLLKEDWPEGHEGLVGRVPDGADKWSILTEESKGSSNGN